MNTIIFIVSKLSQPRCIKRIKSIIDMGYPYKVYGFDDGSYNTDLKALPFTVTEVLKVPRCESFFDKIKANIYPFKAIRDVIKSNSPNAVYYVFGYELAKTIFLLGCRNYVYEEADINSAKFENRLHRKLAIRLDKRIAIQSLLTVYTSMGFVNYLFGASRKKPNYLVIPNKLSSYFDEAKRNKITKETNISKLHFGFVGLIRYPETIFRFASVIALRYPEYEFHFFGGMTGKLRIPENLEKSKNIFFHGPFANPDDLESIYSQIDINVACYDTKTNKYSINVKVAEPNKLYESIYFKVPLVVSSGTYVGERVVELGVGTTIDCSKEDSIISFIDSIDNNVLDTYIRNASIIHTQDLVYDPQELLNKIDIFVH